MNSYEAIRDRYEDALLERMMEAVRTAQGQAALAESQRLREDPGAAVPRSLDQKCRQLIRRGYRKGQLHRSGRITLRVAGRVAVIVALLMVTFAVAYAASPAIRTATNTWIVNTFKDGTEITSPTKPDTDPGQPDERRPSFEDVTIHAGWLPDRFELSASGSSADKKWIVYKEPSGCTFEAEIVYSVGGKNTIHSPYSEIKQIEINEVPALLLPMGERDYWIVWTLEEFGADVLVMGSGVSEVEALLFAQNLLFE